MRRILAGIETEYGFVLEGRGAEHQIDDAMEFVRGYPGRCYVGWDYRFESPRQDLRGFRLDRLATDPVDARFDTGRVWSSDVEIRSDRVLPNGARFYNDHGHPEYSTPECWSLNELALHDRAGEIVLLRAAAALADKTGCAVQVIKNNTDFHGASYGTHESYLVPRSLGFERLCAAVMPMLIARQVLCGAGKLGSEHGPPTRFQLSQRADFFVEPINAETLYRRPIFNTRDEPHADPQQWMRLHVICGDANLIPSATRRKVGLVKLAILLALEGQAPVWKFRDPVAAFKAISRDEEGEFCCELAGGSWTTAPLIIDSYLAAAEAVLGLTPNLPSEIRVQDAPMTDEGELKALIGECRRLLEMRTAEPGAFARHVDWAAKKQALAAFAEAERMDLGAPEMQAYDLAYHDIHPETGLLPALVTEGMAEPVPDEVDVLPRLQGVMEPTRAAARGLAIRHFADHLVGVSWGCLTFEIDGTRREVKLDPDREYRLQQADLQDVRQFVEALERTR